MPTATLTRRVMTNVETAAHIRGYLRRPAGLAFSWPTDPCGYEQHIRFVGHRNSRWSAWASGGGDFESFCRDYADRLERGEFGTDPDAAAKAAT